MIKTQKIFKINKNLLYVLKSFDSKFNRMIYAIRKFFKMPIRNSSKSEDKFLRKIHGTLGIILYVLDSGRTMGVFYFFVCRRHFLL